MLSFSHIVFFVVVFRLTQSFDNCEGSSTTFVGAFASTNGSVIDAPGVAPPPSCDLESDALAACVAFNLTGPYSGQGLTSVVRSLQVRCYLRIGGEGRI